MESRHLWAPWRSKYLAGLKTGAGSTPDFLAEAWAHPQNDPANLVLHRNATGLILLNRYPYTNGHLLVAPALACTSLLDLDAPARAALMEQIALAESALREVFEPQGINIGCNEGRAAGAALPGHLHFHVVPRWAGDTNFMDVVGAVRVIPQALEETYAMLRPVLDRCAEA